MSLSELVCRSVKLVLFDHRGSHGCAGAFSYLMTVFMFELDNKSWRDGAGMGRLAGYYWKQEWGLECVCRAIRTSFTIFSMPGNMSLLAQSSD